MSTLTNTRLIISILQQIPRHPGSISVSALREKLQEKEQVDIPVRNMQRYLSQVKGHFGLDCMDAEFGNAKMWFVENVERRNPDRVHMPTPRAVSHVIAQQLLEHVAPKPILKSLESVFKQAHTSLSPSGGFCVELSKKVKVIQDGLPTIKKSVTQEVIDVALECILCETQVDIVYQPEKSVHPKKYRVSPLAIVVKGASQYLVCIDERSASDKPRHFLFNHLLECESTQTDIDRKYLVGSTAFELNKYCESEGLETNYSSKTITLIAEVKSEAWQSILDHPISEDQRLDAKTDGDTQNKILSATVNNSYELKRWIFSHSNNITVLEPFSLRNSIQEGSINTVDNYQELSNNDHKKLG